MGEQDGLGWQRLARLKIGGIAGEIHSLWPRVPIVVAGPRGTKKSFDALLDTGFDGALSISRRDVELLDLRFLSDRIMVLADGTEHDSAVFAGRVYFAGEWREVPIMDSGDDAMVGLQLVYGARLTLDVVLDGDVDLDFLSDRRLNWDLA